MKRREFVAGTGLIATQLGIATPRGGEAATNGIAPSRTSRLFDNSGLLNAIVQDLIVWNGVNYCLYRDQSTKTSGFAITTGDGNVIRKHDLPRDAFLALGIQGDDILLHALSYSDGVTTHPHAILRLENSGTLRLVHSLGTQLAGQLVFAGDSHLLQVNLNGALTLWRVNDLKLASVATVNAEPYTTLPHADLVAPDVICLTRKDGSSLRTVNLQSGISQGTTISVPEISAAIASYQDKPAGTGSPLVVPVTGSSQDGSLYAIVFPSVPESVPAVKISQSGTGAKWCSLQFMPRSGANSRSGAAFGVPLKMLPGTADVGLAFADGSISWYRI